MFISPAYAQSLLGDTSSLTSMLPLVLIFVVFYFFLIRPQQTKAKQHRTMLDALRRGDRVVTGGGIIASVAKVLNDQEIQLEIADGVRIRVVRSTISSVLAKTEPVGAKGKASDKAEKDKLADDDAAAADKTPEMAGAEAEPAKPQSLLRRFMGGN
jgi:preprotein translocase subunit YajC